MLGKNQLRIHGAHLAGLQDAEEWIEEGWDQGGSAERNGLGHPVDGRHHQHVGAARLLWGTRLGLVLICTVRIKHVR